MKIIEIAKGKLGRGVHQSTVSATSRYLTRAATRVTLSLSLSLSLLFLTSCNVEYIN
jgi:hypothetical protein